MPSATSLLSGRRSAVVQLADSALYAAGALIVICLMTECLFRLDAIHECHCMAERAKEVRLTAAEEGAERLRRMVELRDRLDRAEAGARS